MDIMVKDLMNDLEKGGDRIKEHLKDKKVTTTPLEDFIGVDPATSATDTIWRHQVVRAEAQREVMMRQQQMAQHFWGQALGAVQQLGGGLR